MKVAGGIYREECLVPHWSRLFGSGGRAAAAVGLLSPRSELHGFACRAWAEDVKLSMGAFSVEAHLTEIDEDIAFSYLHSLSVPDLFGAPEVSRTLPVVSGAAILRFGLVEGDAKVDGDRVVYDPQNWQDALAFHDNGSRANSLALVLNELELEKSTGERGSAAVQEVLRATSAEVVVVKRGPRGAAVFVNGNSVDIPAFRSPSVFKIGSGDVFSAHFALNWAERGLPPERAALEASLAVARYVATRDTQAIALVPAPARAPTSIAGAIYLAGPFFTLSQRWLVEETRNALQRLGAVVFSPLHDVGVGKGAQEIADLDLAGLRQCKAVLALLDGEDAGTMFEIGYARDRSIPVIGFSESPRPESLTMLEGSGCKIVSEFATAVYEAFWAASE